MADPVNALVLDLLEWLRAKPRPYAEVMEAWRTSCPRLPIWEEANARGFVVQEHQEGIGSFVSVSPSGRRWLAYHRASPSQPGATQMRLSDLAARLLALPGVSQGTSRFARGAKPAWLVGSKEFAHLHADDLLDLRLPRSVQASLKDDPRAHFRRSRSEWLEVEFHHPEDVEFVVGLARQAWAAAC